MAQAQREAVQPPWWSAAADWWSALPVRHKMTTALLVLALPPMLIVGYLGYRALADAARQQFSAEAEAFTKGQSEDLAENMRAFATLSQQVAAAQITQFLGAEPGQRESYLNAVLDSSPYLRRVVLVDQRGAIIASAPRNNRSAVEIPEAVQRGEQVSQFGVYEGQPQLWHFVPISAPSGVRLTLFTSADLAALEGGTQVPRTEAGAFSAIADEQGRIIYSTLPGYQDAFKSVNLQQDQQVGAALRGEFVSGRSVGGLGDVTLAAAPVQGTKWAFVYAIPTNHVLNTVAGAQFNLLRGLVITTGLLLLLVAGVGTLLSRRLVAPAMGIGVAMSRVRAGDLSARAPIMGRDELGQLGHDVNATLDSITALVQTREERNELQQGITRLLDEVSAVASGDLTAEAQVTADQTGAIADAFNYMIEELRALVQRMQMTADQMTSAATAVTGLTDDLVVSAEEQTRRLDEARASVTTMTSLITNVRTTVGESVTATGAAQTAVESGQQAVSETLDAMSRLRSETQETAKKIKRLGESSQEIGEVVRLINEIADQTHLLALNASIHAAMAGEHGRGFAIVAEEVRALAERSASATSKIDDLIRAIQADTSAATVAMERSTKEVVTSSRLADQTGHALTAIGDVTAKIAHLSTQIEDLVEHQFQSAWALEGTVRDVVGTTAEATQAVRSVATGMQELNELAETLREAVSAFKIEREPEAVADPTGEPGEIRPAVAA